MFKDEFKADMLPSFSMKCGGYLKHIYETAYAAEHLWAEKMRAFQSFCRDVLEPGLPEALKAESELVKWEESLHAVFERMKIDIYNTEFEKDEAGKWKRAEATEQEHAVFAKIADDYQYCLKCVKEMLRILEPGEAKYKQWSTWDTREDFLMHIGFIDGPKKKVLPVWVAPRKSTSSLKVESERLLSRLKELTRE